MVQSISGRHVRGGKMQITEVVLSDGTGALRITFFNQPWITNRLKEDMSISVSGKIEQYLGRLVMNNPEWEPVEVENLSTNRRVDDADAGIAARRAEIVRLEDAVVRRGFQLVDGNATPEQRTQALLDTKQIGERIGRLKSEIEALERDRERYARELEAYRATLASRR